MFKLIKNTAEQIQGADIFPSISLVIFFLFFTGLVIYVARMDKSRTQLHSNIPLDGEDVNPIN